MSSLFQHAEKVKRKEAQQDTEELDEDYHQRDLEDGSQIDEIEATTSLSTWTLDKVSFEKTEEETYQAKLKTKPFTHLTRPYPEEEGSTLHFHHEEVRNGRTAPVKETSANEACGADSTAGFVNSPDENDDGLYVVTSWHGVRAILFNIVFFLGYRNSVQTRAEAENKTTTTAAPECTTSTGRDSVESQKTGKGSERRRTTNKAVAAYHKNYNRREIYKVTRIYGKLRHTRTETKSFCCSNCKKSFLKEQLNVLYDDVERQECCNGCFKTKRSEQKQRRALRTPRFPYQDSVTTESEFTTSPELRAFIGLYLFLMDLCAFVSLCYY